MTKREIAAIVRDVAARCDRDLAMQGPSGDAGYRTGRLTRLDLKHPRMPRTRASVRIISGYVRQAIERATGKRR